MEAEESERIRNARNNFARASLHCGRYVSDGAAELVI
jgi:hypothetical protein